MNRFVICNNIYIYIFWDVLMQTLFICTLRSFKHHMVNQGNFVTESERLTQQLNIKTTIVSTVPLSCPKLQQSSFSPI